jgi:hypothetical protein
MTTPQTLLFDADDTLWENAVYFAATRRGFFEIMAGEGCDPLATQAALEEIETAQIRRGWPKTCIPLRADSGFAREALMAWIPTRRIARRV